MTTATSEKKQLEAIAVELYEKLQAIVSDFDLYFGEVYQSYEGDSAAIGRARVALRKFENFQNGSNK